MQDNFKSMQPCDWFEGKFKLFPKGIKDKPRFPQFMSIRNENDL